MFGNLLETFAIYVSSRTDQGVKSKLRSIDLEFRRGVTYYVVGIKSGTNWGNSDQIMKMKENFKAARVALRKGGIGAEIIAVNGCMYGTETIPLKEALDDPDKIYFKYAGQDFWQFISGDDDLYRKLIIPIGVEAKRQDPEFRTVYAAQVNAMTQGIMRDFIRDNQIDWTRLIEFVSQRGGSGSDT